MRAISAAQESVLSAGSKSRAEFKRLSVQNTAGAWIDLGTFAGTNMVDEVTLKEDADGPGMLLDARCKREVGKSLSLASLMTGSALNRGFDPAAAYAALLDLTRGIKVEAALMPLGRSPAAGDWFEVFRGYIEQIDEAAGNQVAISASDQSSLLKRTYIETERIYAWADLGSGNTASVQVWQPSTVFAAGALVVPSDANQNGHYYSWEGGTTGATEPVWPTGSGSTVADNGNDWTEDGATSDAGFAVEKVIQNILDDNGLSAVVLYTPTSPSFSIRPLKQDDMTVLQAVQRLALACGGWDCRYKWRTGTAQFELTLWCPDRAGSTVARTITPGECGALERLSRDIETIRNKVTCTYSDSDEALDPANDPPRLTVSNTVTAAITASRARYGTLAMGLSEAWSKDGGGDTSPIDTAAEAQAMVDAAAADLSEPVCDQVAPFKHGFLFVELGDVYTYAPNNKHYDTAQTLGVYGYSHTFRGGFWQTTINTRGKPGLGVLTWHKAADNPARGRKGHAKTMFNSAGASQLEVTGVVGGSRLTLSNQPDKKSSPMVVEFHVDTSSGFTPSAATLVGMGAQRSVVVPHLVPGTTYFTKYVPRTRNASRIIRGQPSVEQSFVAGRAFAAHLDPYVSAGHFPYNGAFEHAFRPIATSPPDHWEMSSGTWGTQALAGTDGDGGRSIVLDSVAGATAVKSSLFPTQGGYYNLLGNYKASGTNATPIYFQIVVYFYKDSAGTASSTLASRTHNIDSASLGVWLSIPIRRQSIPDDANFVAIEVKKSASASDYKIEIGEVHCTRATIEQEWWNAVSFANSWVDYGGGFAPAEYYLDSFERVHLQGSIKDGTINAAAFTLPTGYRPGYSLRFVTWSNGTAGLLGIATTGVVTPITGTNAYFSLDGVSFRVA